MEVFSAAAIGISFIQFANKNSMRNIYVLGISLFLGISIPQYFVMNTDITGHGPVRTPAGWVRTITSHDPSLSFCDMHLTVDFRIMSCTCNYLISD